MRQLEGLSFIPEADHSLDVQSNKHPGDWSLKKAILMGRFEVTRGDFLKQLARQGGRAQIPAQEWETREYNWASEALALPAEMTFGEAVSHAESLGMRLPTAREWLHVATGRTGSYYPWGRRDQHSVCNTEDSGIGAPTLVGTFASGRSPLFDCHDMLGNLWEWTSSYVPGRMDSDFTRKLMPPQGAGGLLDAGSVSVMGGSYSSPKFALYTWDGVGDVYFNSRTVDKASMTPEIGARLCADAEEYLWDNAASWGDSLGARSRVERVGKRWAHDRFAREQLGALLERLRQREGAPAALAWLMKGVEGSLLGG